MCSSTADYTEDLSAVISMSAPTSPPFSSVRTPQFCPSEKSAKKTEIDILPGDTGQKEGFVSGSWDSAQRINRACPLVLSPSKIPLIIPC